MRDTRMPMRSVLAGLWSLCLLATLMLAACGSTGSKGSDQQQASATPTTTAQSTPTSGSGDNGNGGGGAPTQTPLSQLTAYVGGQDNMFYGFSADSGAQR